MSETEFIEEVFEIAFGDDAINRDFSYEEVLEELRDNSDRAWGINMDSSDRRCFKSNCVNFHHHRSMTMNNFISWLIGGWVFCSLVMTYLIIKAPICEDCE